MWYLDLHKSVIILMCLILQIVTMPDHSILLDWYDYDDAYDDEGDYAYDDDCVWHSDRYRARPLPSAGLVSLLQMFCDGGHREAHGFMNFSNKRHVLSHVPASSFLISVALPSGLSV